MDKDKASLKPKNKKDPRKYISKLVNQSRDSTNGSISRM